MDIRKGVKTIVYGKQAVETKEQNRPNIGIGLILSAFPEYVESILSEKSSKLQVMKGLVAASNRHGENHDFPDGTMDIDLAMTEILPAEFSFERFLCGVLSRQVDLDNPQVFPKMCQHFSKYLDPIKKDKKHYSGVKTVLESRFPKKSSESKGKKVKKKKRVEREPASDEEEDDEEEKRASKRQKTLEGSEKKKEALIEEYDKKEKKRKKKDKYLPHVEDNCSSFRVALSRERRSQTDTSVSNLCAVEESNGLPSED